MSGRFNVDSTHPDEGPVHMNGTLETGCFKTSHQRPQRSEV